MDDVEGYVVKIIGYIHEKKGHEAKLLRLTDNLDRVVSQVEHLNIQIDKEKVKLDSKVNIINDEIFALGVQLNLHNFTVRSLKSLKVLVKIWALGIEDFTFNILPILSPEANAEMLDNYGQNLDFALWTEDLKDVSNENLQELKEALQAALAENVEFVERHHVITTGITTITAEFGRRDVIAEREKANRFSERQENWVVRGAND